MSITVELSPEVEERLRIQAAARGVELQDYVERLVRQAAITPSSERPTLAEFEADWNSFADGLDHLAPLHPEAFSREAMYDERD